jgi:hypothetical protein
VRRLRVEWQDRRRLRVCRSCDHAFPSSIPAHYSISISDAARVIFQRG